MPSSPFGAYDYSGMVMRQQQRAADEDTRAQQTRSYFANYKPSAYEQEQQLRQESASAQLEALRQLQSELGFGGAGGQGGTGAAGTLGGPAGGDALGGYGYDSLSRLLPTASRYADPWSAREASRGQGMGRAAYLSSMNQGQAADTARRYDNLMSIAGQSGAIGNRMASGDAASAQLNAQLDMFRQQNQLDQQQLAFQQQQAFGTMGGSSPYMGSGAPVNNQGVSSSINQLFGLSGALDLFR